MVDFLNSYFDPKTFSGGLLSRLLPASQFNLQPGAFPEPPALGANEASPLDTAQWPAGPAGAPSNAFASADKPQAPVSAPLSLAPPAASMPPAESPGALDRISNGLANNSNMLIALGSGIAQGGIGKGLQSALAGAELDRKQGNQNLTQQALIKKGLDADMARAVSANPALLASVAGTLFKPQVRSLTSAEKTQAGLPENLPWFVGNDGKPFVPDGISQLKPTYGVTGKDQFGVEQYGWIDPQTRTTSPGQAGSAPAATGAAVIPPAPPGVDPKIWREKQSERAAADAMPADAKVSTQLRQEVQSLPSYKNLAQAAPVYRSMFDAAGRDNRAADVNLIYGMAKIMDPGSVVRESEMSVAQAIATLPQRLQAEVKSQVEKTGRLTPELRQDIMQEANSRIRSYQYQFDQDAAMTRGIAERNRIDTRDVIPDFGKFDDWKAAPRPAPAASPGPTTKTKPGGNYIWQNGRLVPQ